MDPSILQKLYSIPPFGDVRDFLIRIALTRGRFGKVRYPYNPFSTRAENAAQGGIPDLEGSAVSILRDWNSGKIPFYTTPPAMHPSSAPAPRVSGDDEGARHVNGDARILSTLSEAFTLDGVFDSTRVDDVWNEDQISEDAMIEEYGHEGPRDTESIADME